MMAVMLEKGESYPYGILAKHSYVHGPDGPREELQPVVRVLKNHHDLNLQEVSGTRHLFAAVYEEYTKTLGWSDQAAIVRVRYGAGRLVVLSDSRESEILHLDCGDWAYVPAGVSFRMQGMVIHGMNLQVYVGAVRPV
jgi:hypothetical protein